MTISLLAMWQTERWGEPPPADLAACARQRIAELERAIQTMQPPALAGYAMEFTPGDSLEGRISALVRLQDGWRGALDEATVRYTCWACDRELDANQVCAACCGAETLPGRCGLPAGHRGEHEAPVPVVPR